MATELGTRIGERIRARRVELGLSQRELADRMPDARAVSNQHISNWERAINRPSDRYIEQLAEALEMDVASLVSREPPVKPPTPDLVAGFTGDVQPAWAIRLESKVDELLELQRAAPARARMPATPAEAEARIAAPEPLGRTRRAAETKAPKRRQSR